MPDSAAHRTRPRAVAGTVNITASAVSLYIADAAASSEFFTTYLGYREELRGEGYICLSRDDAAADIVLLEHSAEAPPQDSPGPQHMAVSFTVTAIADEHDRLRRAGAPITTPLRQQPWGEWALRLTDPNGVMVELVEWVPPAGA
ncbi:VOC family protein [Streptomyces sp. NBC_01431]|uniref:VOC family protein n=1 Tax=Streptomyces sp. NBC_01431 TaxID=2903863 RepID=UPI002E31897E|nr:VOC family protein [Streptomyces sp. NBC_01431]